MDLLFLAILFGLVFGSQAYNGLKHFVFPDYYRGYYGLKFGLWLMCVVLDGFVIYKWWWTLFIIGVFHILIFILITNCGGGDYLATPAHPKGRKEKEYAKRNHI